MMAGLVRPGLRNRFILKRPLSGLTSRTKIRAVLSKDLDGVGDQVKVQGWIKSVRKHQNSLTFIELFDGSCSSSLQAVVDSTVSTTELSSFSTGASAEVIGEVIRSEGKQQTIEIRTKTLTLLGQCPADTYPLQKKRHSLEFLRSIAHLRGRTNTFGAVTRVRSALSFATHQFFQEEGFLHLHTPIITSSDCEGAGDMFRVTAPTHSSPTTQKEFFGQPTFLTVSGQLSAETYACSVGDVYTFGPTFRAENSNTSRHLAEFQMVEPELAFADMKLAMDNAEGYIKHVVSYVLQNCADDLRFFMKYYDQSLLPRLENIVENPFERISYCDAISLLQDEIKKSPTDWTFRDVKFGTDLSTEHERWLCEKAFQKCVFVHNYPKEIKAFYMRNNDDGKTVDAFDLLVPGMGELIGGSQREERLDVLMQKMEANGLDVENYNWYMDTRRYGTIPHAGYGLGFERLVCFVTGMDNIRDAVAFPRYPGHALF